MTSADEQIYPPGRAAADTEPVDGSAPKWRRITGGVIIAIGALLLAGFAALFVVVTLTFVEWRSALDGLLSVAMVCAGPMLAGVALMALGRWIHGGWRTETPIARGVSIVFPALGVLAAFAAIAMFFWVLFAETGRGGVWALAQFVVSIAASLTVVAIGVAARPDRRSRA